jgi:hypothetical protein
MQCALIHDCRFVLQIVDPLVRGILSAGIKMCWGAAVADVHLSHTGFLSSLELKRTIGTCLGVCSDVCAGCDIVRLAAIQACTLWRWSLTSTSHLRSCVVLFLCWSSAVLLYAVVSLHAQFVPYMDLTLPTLCAVCDIYGSNFTYVVRSL